MVPSRLLTDAECDRLTMRLRKNQGEIDPMKLVQLDRDMLLDIGFTEDDLQVGDYRNPSLEEKEEHIVARPMMRVLISFPIDEALEARKIIKKFDVLHGVEIIYGSDNEDEDGEDGEEDEKES